MEYNNWLNGSENLPQNHKPYLFIAVNRRAAQELWICFCDNDQDLPRMWDGAWAASIGAWKYKVWDKDIVQQYTNQTSDNEAKEVVIVSFETDEEAYQRHWS